MNIRDITAKSESLASLILTWMDQGAEKETIEKFLALELADAIRDGIKAKDNECAERVAAARKEAIEECARIAHRKECRGECTQDFVDGYKLAAQDIALNVRELK